MQSVIKDPQLSLVIPVFNEAGNIAPLLAETAAAFEGRSFEIIVVDDASDDGSGAEIAAADTPARVLTHERRSGKSRALVTGFRAARGRWIATLDGDGQNDPRDVAAIADAYGDRAPEFLVAGVRNRRNDGAVKLVTSRIANFVRRRMLRDNCRDAGCGVKMMPTRFAQELPYFDNMHRFLPALARRAGLDVLEHEISDRPRQHGVSKYGFFDRAAVALLDMIGVYWLIRRASDPVAVTERETEAGAGAVALKAVQTSEN
ncbi:MAG: glycosyltransferase family 2 protein [Pseudomonadota bacterium]